MGTTLGRTKMILTIKTLFGAYKVLGSTKTWPFFKSCLCIHIHIYTYIRRCKYTYIYVNTYTNMLFLYKRKYCVHANISYTQILSSYH